MMSDTQSQSNQPPLTSSSELDPEPLDTKSDELIGETSKIGTQAENPGSPIEDDGSQAADLDEL